MQEIKQLKEELQLCRSQLSKTSIEKDQTVFELNKMVRMIERLQITINEKETEIQALNEQLNEQEQYYTKQIENIKQHYEYLKESALARLKSEMSMDQGSIIQELKETKQIYLGILSEVHDKRKSSLSQEDTRCQSINDYNKLIQEKQELQQLVNELQKVQTSLKSDQSDDLIEEIQYLRTQLSKLTSQLEQSKQTIISLQTQILNQQDKLREIQVNDISKC